MFISSATATVSTLIAAVFTVYALIDSQHRVRAERLYPREKVSRFGSILSTVRYLSSSLISWRSTVRQRTSPFPDYVREPIPTNSPDAATPLTKDTHGSPNYGVISTENDQQGR